MDTPVQGTVDPGGCSVLITVKILNVFKDEHKYKYRYEQKNGFFFPLCKRHHKRRIKPSHSLTRACGDVQFIQSWCWKTLIRSTREHLFADDVLLSIRPVPANHVSLLAQVCRREQIEKSFSTECVIVFEKQHEQQL